MTRSWHSVRAGWLGAAVASALLAAAPAFTDDLPEPRLRMVRCDPPEVAHAGVECGTFKVWENRSQRSGRTLDLAFKIYRQKGGTPPADRALFLHAGGPGVDGMSLDRLVQRVFDGLRSDREIVLVDQRGSGRSNSLTCWPDDIDTNPAAVFGQIFSPEIMRNCRERMETRADLTQYTTETSVDDFEELRSALGYEMVDFWGGSYGSRFGLVWLQRHPNSLSTVVLDGPVPPSLQSPLYMARDAQAAVDRILGACENQSTCRGDTALRQDLNSLLDRLAEGPLPATVVAANGTRAEVELQRGDLAYAIRGMLYEDGAFASLPSQIRHAARTGDLSAFAQPLYNRFARLSKVLSSGLHLSVFCTEDVLGIDPATAERETRDTLIGTYMVEQYSAACDAWRRGEVSDGFYAPVTADVPVLILSGELDPSTPSVWGDAIAEHLPNVRHIRFPQGAHGVLDSACGRSLTLDFFKSGAAAVLDTSCIDTGPLEFDVE